MLRSGQVLDMINNYLGFSVNWYRVWRNCQLISSVWQARGVMSSAILNVICIRAVGSLQYFVGPVVTIKDILPHSLLTFL